jgi:hypothetical protein
VSRAWSGFLENFTLDEIVRFKERSFFARHLRFGGAPPPVAAPKVAAAAAAGAAGAAGGAAVVGALWVCRVCTYAQNPPTERQCDMCSAKRA